MNRKQGTKGGIQIFFGCKLRHRRGEAAEGYAEKLLNYLITYNAVSTIKAFADELSRASCLRWSVNIEGINENVCIEKVFSAHSFRRA